MPFVHSRKPYYAWYQALSRSANQNFNLNTSSLEFWEWFDNRLTRRERDYINQGRNGQEVIDRCHQVISKQEGWLNVKR